MSNDITGGLRNLKAGNIDSLRGPYPTVAAANLAVPNSVVDGQSFRLGKYVDIGTVGNLQTYWWNGTDYADNKLVPYFKDLAKEADFTPVKTKVETVTAISPNIVNPALALSSAWNAAGFSGGVTAANWVRLDKQPILPNTDYVYTGNGVIGATIPLVVFSDANNNPLPDENILSDGTANQVRKFKTGPNVRFFGANVVNRTGQGLKPLETPELNTLIIAAGTKVPSFEPYGSLLKHDRMDYNPSTNDLSIIAKINNFSITSRNRVNMLLDPVKGRIFAGTGIFTSASSNNWLCIPRKLVDPDDIGKQFTISNTGQISSEYAVVSIRDASGNVIFEIIGGGTTQWTTFTFTMPAGAYDIAYTIGNVIDAGIYPYNNIFTKVYQVEEGPLATAPIIKGQTMGDASKLLGDLPPEVVGYKTNEVVVIKTNATTLAVHFYGGTDNSKWIKVEYLRVTSAEKFFDTWKLNQVFITKRTSDLVFVNELKLVKTGVWENALGKGGEAYPEAFYGSTHGFEMFTEVTLMLDDKLLDPADGTKTSWKGTRFSAFQKSFIKKPNGIDNAMSSFKRWEITSNYINIKNWIRFLVVRTTPWNFYLQMISSLRKSETNPFTQITTTAIPNDTMTRNNVSEPGFVNDVYFDLDSTVGPSNPIRTSIFLYGERSSIEMTVNKREIHRADGTFLPRGNPDAGMFVQNTSEYNKIYGPNGANTYQIGDVIHSDATYIIRGS